MIGDSWEEQAFAKDTAFGGFIWPPRSYSCSFCGREFKSAQALGGHMNVHRRDKARLNQQSSISILVPLSDSEKGSLLSLKLSRTTATTSSDSSPLEITKKNSPSSSQLLVQNRPTDHVALLSTKLDPLQNFTSSIEDLDLELRLGSNPLSNSKC